MKRRRRPIRIAIGIDLQWPYKHHVDLVEGILRYAAQRGWRCEIRPLPETAVKVSLPSGRYDGIIARATKSLASTARRLRIPAVNVWLASPDTSLPRVTSDSRASARMAAEHFLERGFRRFGLLGYTRNRHFVLQRAGLQAATGARVNACHVPEFRRISSSWPRFERALAAWIRSWTLPIAVLASDDLLARYLADACVEQGFRIPDDVSIIGCGNNEIICERMSPSLTSIEMGYDRVGHRAAKTLEGLMRGRRPAASAVVVPPEQLVARRSTDVFVVDDRLVAAALRKINDDASRRLGVRDVVGQFPVTRRSLERRFRDVLGRTIHEEILRARIRLAKRLLTDEDMPLKVVARSAGFSGPENLALVFRRLEGVAPGAWRQRQRAGD